MSNSTSRKRGLQYSNYPPEIRAKIGKYACAHGTQPAVRKFTKDLGKPLSESTVRSMKKRYLEELSKRKDPTDVTSLEHKNRGQPLLVGKDIEHSLSVYLKNLQVAGGVVNRSIIIAAAKGIIKHRNRSLLKEYGGSLSLTRAWAYSFMKRHNLVRRKGTKEARKRPPDFEEIKENFQKRIREVLKANKIKDDAMIINWDQTGSKFIPCSEWTLEVQGSKQVPIKGLDDKREMTVLMTVNAAGDVIPPQLLYAGTTQQCHGKAPFPNNWDIWHSKNHWSEEATMLHFLEVIVIPYFEKTRESLDLPATAPGVAIFDVFSAHRVDSVKTALKNANIEIVYIPAGCTSDFQPLDLTVNDFFKKRMKEYFTEFYADIVTKHLDNGKELENLSVDLRTSVIKPIHGQWLIKAFEQLSQQKDLVKKGFDQGGITEAIRSGRLEID